MAFYDWIGVIAVGFFILLTWSQLVASIGRRVTVRAGVIEVQPLIGRAREAAIDTGVLRLNAGPLRIFLVRRSGAARLPLAWAVPVIKGSSADRALTRAIGSEGRLVEIRGLKDLRRLIAETWRR